MENQIACFLQPLRIPDGWTIDFNIFTHFEPTEENAEYTYGEWLFIASHKRNRVGLELQFEPEGDPNGHFILDYYHLRINEDPNQIPIEEIRKRSTKEIVVAIENLMRRVPPVYVSTSQTKK